MERSHARAHRPLIRRDAEGRGRTAPDWESLVERLIREAQEAGAFDELPDHGRRLRLEDDSGAGDLAMTHHLLRNAGLAPPWIETDKEARATLDRIEALLLRAQRKSGARHLLERELDSLSDAYDRAVRRLEIEAPTPRQHRAPLDRPALRARLEQALRTRSHHGA